MSWLIRFLPYCYFNGICILQWNHVFTQAPYIYIPYILCTSQPFVVLLQIKQFRMNKILVHINILYLTTCKLVTYNLICFMSLWLVPHLPCIPNTHYCQTGRVKEMCFL